MIIYIYDSSKIVEIQKQKSWYNLKLGNKEKVLSKKNVLFRCLCLNERYRRFGTVILKSLVAKAVRCESDVLVTVTFIFHFRNFGLRTFEKKTI